MHTRTGAKQEMGSLIMAVLTKCSRLRSQKTFSTQHHSIPVGKNIHSISSNAKESGGGTTRLWQWVGAATLKGLRDSINTIDQCDGKSFFPTLVAGSYCPPFSGQDSS